MDIILNRGMLQIDESSNFVSFISIRNGGIINNIIFMKICIEFGCNTAFIRTVLIAVFMIMVVLIMVLMTTMWFKFLLVIVYVEMATSFLKRL